jgi:hypothetical protein
MPGADQTDSLLRSCAWRADKLLRQRGHFNTVLWLALYPDGHRQWSETNCDCAPDSASDQEVLAELADGIGLQFTEARVTGFAVAYLCNRVTKLRPLDPAASPDRVEHDAPNRSRSPECRTGRRNNLSWPSTRAEGLRRLLCACFLPAMCFKYKTTRAISQKIGT